LAPGQISGVDDEVCCADTKHLGGGILFFNKAISFFDYFLKSDLESGLCDLDFQTKVVKADPYPRFHWHLRVV